MNKTERVRTVFMEIYTNVIMTEAGQNIGSVFGIYNKT